jgi:hypothetical protein
MPPKKPQVLVDAEVAELVDLYASLITELHSIHTRYGIDGDQLAACEAATVAVKSFLDANELIFDAGITRPLGALALAVRDLQRGAKPKLFQVEPASAGGRPSSGAENAIKATAAACLDFLHERAKESLANASNFVANELSKVGVKRLGTSRAITSKTVQGWRAEMNGRNSPLANKIFADIKKGLGAQMGDRPTSDAAKRAVKGAIKGLAAEGVSPSLPAR